MNQESRIQENMETNTNYGSCHLSNDSLSASISSSTSSLFSLRNDKIKKIGIILTVLCFGIYGFQTTSQKYETTFSHQSTTLTNPSHISLNQFNQLEYDKIIQKRENLFKECQELWIDQFVDHFQKADDHIQKDDDHVNKGKTYSQRYFVCDQYWKNKKHSGRKGPIFFYTGNEGNVELYLKQTGFMWETAPKFGALLVFAEHRYFGESIPFGKHAQQNLQYLSSKQALEDYAVLINSLKQKYQAEDSAVIAFGGSYGGMLAAWFRMQYPHLVDGALAASAPLLGFTRDSSLTTTTSTTTTTTTTTTTLSMDPSAFYASVTRDATSFGGTTDTCAKNIQKSWNVLFEHGKTWKGRQTIQQIFQLCDPLESEQDVQLLYETLQGSYVNMAMGNFPYPSSYIKMGKSYLPAFPIRKACSYYNNFTSQHQEQWLHALRQSTAVYYNNTGTLSCYSINNQQDPLEIEAKFWGYLSCSEMPILMESNGITDMFLPTLQGKTLENDFIQSCQEDWNVTPSFHWVSQQYGGLLALKTASNIVFSNGDLDPWTPYGVLQNYSSSVVSLMIKDGAHHLDLMFSHPLDTLAVQQVRQIEILHIQKWIQDAYIE